MYSSYYAICVVIKTFHPTLNPSQNQFISMPKQLNNFVCFSLLLYLYRAFIGKYVDKCCLIDMST